MPGIYQPSEDSYFLSKILKKEIPMLLDKNKNLNVLEIRSGSGIQFSTLKESGVKSLVGLDINPDAVKHCKRLGFKCILSDIFSKVSERFDLIIFNPPYLPKDKFDKEKDTTGGKKGSEIINRFLEQAKNHLNKNGKIILLTSSLTKGIKWRNYNKKLLGKNKLFFEQLYVWGLKSKQT